MFAAIIHRYSCLLAALVLMTACGAAFPAPADVQATTYPAPAVTGSPEMPTATATSLITPSPPPAQEIGPTVTATLPEPYPGPYSATPIPPTPMAPPLGAEIASGSVLTDYSIVPPLEFTRRELDSAYPLHDLHNGTFVSLDYDNEVYLVNLESGERQQITQDGLPKSEAVLSDQYIVWAAKGGEALDVYSQPYWLHHLFVHDRATGETRQITELPAQRRGLAIDGNLLVWSDDLKAREDITFEFDVYAYDLATSTEYPIGVVPGNQQEPDIYGSRVVWQEGERIYLYDLEAQAGRVLVENRWPKANPSIYGNRVVWEMTADVAGQPPSQSGPWSDLYMLDLDTGVMQLLTRTPVREENPELQDNRVLWVVRGGSCDVGELGPDGKPIPHSGGVYVLDLVTEETVKLTDYVEPRAWLDRDTIVIDEACMGGFFGYALQLSQH